MLNSAITNPEPAGQLIHQRVIALFPGAFRPPHQAHLTAVLSLAARPDVTEVVVIISNRSRPLPGTTKVMPAETVSRIWAIYLQHVAKVRVEIAPHAAVDHALDYFNRVSKEDSLLFCIGESDFANGDERFAQIAELSQQCGIAAEIAPAPTGHLQVRATDLRIMLARGHEGRTDFMAALPAELTVVQRAQVWQECVNGLVQLDEMTLARVNSILAHIPSFKGAELVVARPDKVDPVLRAQTADGQILFIKYAGDTVDGHVSQTGQRKPRGRLSVEKRALSRLRDYQLAHIELMQVQLPDVLHFDKATRMLIQQAVCSDGWSLQDELSMGRFDVRTARQIARFMVNCHTAPDSIRPLWGDRAQDIAHWESILERRFMQMHTQHSSSTMRNVLERLRQQSQQAQRGGFFHLDLLPPNIRSCPRGQIGVIDFEMSATLGDPAYEVGLLLGHYLFWGICTLSQAECRVAAAQLLNTYRQGVGAACWAEMCSRCAAFAGAIMLQLLGEAAPAAHRPGLAEVKAVGCRLLLFRPELREFVWLLGTGLL